MSDLEVRRPDQHTSNDRLDEPPVADPGLEPHQRRITDVDAAAADRAERYIAACFGVATLLALAFCVGYFAVPRDAELTIGPLQVNASNFVLGTTMGLALGLIGVGAIQWARRIMSDHEIVEERHPAGSTEADRRTFRAEFEKGAAESGFGRRKLIRNSLLGAMGVLALPPLVLLRDLGELPGRKLYQTIWSKGIRIVNAGTGEPVKPADLVVGQLVNGEPANLEAMAEHDHTEYLNAKAKAAVIMVRMQPDEIRAKPGRENWGIDGIVCYSKICSHAGCPISLYEQTTHQVLCPCHQSTFDLADSAKVLFGPAGHPLPQLPLMIDSEGFLAAQSDFHEPVGPSFFERGER